MELGKGGNGFWGRRYKGGGWDLGEEARLLWEELSEFVFVFNKMDLGVG
jgi:hypothetical protein